jgi:hypothetical protein
MSQNETDREGQMDEQDRFEINQLYASYGHRIDSGDARGWAELFTADGRWDRVDEPDGPVVFSVAGHDDLEAFAEEDHRVRPGRHWMGNILLEGEAPNVTGRTYGFLIAHVDGEIRWIAHGDFTDELVKTAGGWRFARRTIRPLGPLSIPTQAREATDGAPA